MIVCLGQWGTNHGAEAKRSSNTRAPSRMEVVGENPAV